MLASRRRLRSTINVWPGYVDALSALLMLVIFTLLIFTLAQLFLSEILSNRDRELVELNDRLAEISSLLDLEQQKSRKLDSQVKHLSEQYSLSLEKQYELFGQVDQLKALSDADKEKLKQQLRMMASLQQDIDTLQQLRSKIEQEVGTLALAVKNREQQIETLQGSEKTLQARIAALEQDARSTLGKLSESAAQVGALRDRTRRLEARLADEQERTLLAQTELDQKAVRIEDLVTLVVTSEEALQEEKKLSYEARAQIDRLNRQISALREQLDVIGRALNLAEAGNSAQKVELADLGKRLNTLLARQVNELKRYRSEFFGRLREVLGDNPNIRVVGDRFLLPSELLFASGSAKLGEQGKRELAKLAVTLRQISEKIPPEVNWVLRVDGHTDKQPIHTKQFPSNWELSTARAVSVVRYLARQGIPSSRMAATGFGEFHPVDPAGTPAAFQRNRRIEIKLTDR
jgi:chemotaxis protein MotB